ncbi:FAD-dependent monooxygenase, partial [Vibrio parahaemolyticus]
TLIVGAGPVGLTIALGLARLGRPVTVVTRLPFIAAGSKAICFSKRTLDIWNRLGVARRMIDKGVVWNIGKVFRGAATTP